MAECPICKSKLKIITKKESGDLAYIKCENQKTEKKGADFVEAGSCKFKINFKTKFYELDKSEMKNLLNNEKIGIKDGNFLKLDLKNEMFTSIDFIDKYEEEDF